jgi:hypothetical protein
MPMPITYYFVNYFDRDEGVLEPSAAREATHAWAAERAARQQHARAVSCAIARRKSSKLGASAAHTANG